MPTEFICLSRDLKWQFHLSHHLFAQPRFAGAELQGMFHVKHPLQFQLFYFERGLQSCGEEFHSHRPSFVRPKPSKLVARSNWGSSKAAGGARIRAACCFRK
jgi:hypothetical protein